MPADPEPTQERALRLAKCLLQNRGMPNDSKRPLLTFLAAEAWRDRQVNERTRLRDLSDDDEKAVLGVLKILGEAFATAGEQKTAEVAEALAKGSSKPQQTSLVQRFAAALTLPVTDYGPKGLEVSKGEAQLYAAFAEYFSMHSEEFDGVRSAAEGFVKVASGFVLTFQRHEFVVIDSLDELKTALALPIDHPGPFSSVRRQIGRGGSPTVDHPDATALAKAMGDPSADQYACFIEGCRASGKSTFLVSLARAWIKAGEGASERRVIDLWSGAGDGTVNQARTWAQEETTLVLVDLGSDASRGLIVRNQDLVRACKRLVIVGSRGEPDDDAFRAQLDGMSAFGESDWAQLRAGKWRLTLRALPSELTGKVVDSFASRHELRLGEDDRRELEDVAGMRFKGATSNPERAGTNLGFIDLLTALSASKRPDKPGPWQVPRGLMQALMLTEAFESSDSRLAKLCVELVQEDQVPNESILDYAKKALTQSGIGAEPLRRRRPTRKEQLPPSLKRINDQGSKAFNDGRYEDALVSYTALLEAAEQAAHQKGAIHARINIALVKIHGMRQPEEAKRIAEQCLLDTAHDESLENERANALFALGTAQSVLGELDEAAVSLRKALEIDERRGKKENAGHALLQLGWDAGRRGNLKEAESLTKRALDNFLEARLAEPEDTGIQRGIAAVHYQFARIHRSRHSARDTEKALSDALSWQRSLGRTPDLVKILTEMAELEFHFQKFDEGVARLEEARGICRDLGRKFEEARCVDLMARVAMTQEKPRKAGELWIQAAELAEASEDPEKGHEFSYKTGRALLEIGELGAAKAVFEGILKQLPEHEHGYARCLSALADIAKEENRDADRAELLSRAVEAAAKHLLTVEAPPERANTFGMIGDYLGELGRTLDAIESFERARLVYADLQDSYGVAKSMACIARLHDQSGAHDRAIETYRMLEPIVAGSPFHEISAVVHANLGEDELRRGNLRAARRHLEVSHELSEKYRLRHLDQVTLQLRRLDAQERARQPATTSIESLIRELYEEIGRFDATTEKKGYLHYWLFGRNREIAANVRESVDLKIWAPRAEGAEADAAYRAIGALAEWYFRSVRIDEDKTKGGMVLIPIHEDSRVFPDTPFFLTSDGVAMGFSPHVDESVLEFLITRDSADLIDGRQFALLHSARTFSGELQLAAEYGMIPIYTNSLPDSEDVEVLRTTNISLPRALPNESPEITHACRDALLELSGPLEGGADAALRRLVSTARVLASHAQAGERTQLRVVLLHVRDRSDEPGPTVAALVVSGVATGHGTFEAP